MRRVVRYGVVPALLSLLAAAALHRGLAPEALWPAAAVGTGCGIAGGLLVTARRIWSPLGLVAAAALAYAGAAAVGGSLAATAVPDAVYLFLTVGLPAIGLRSLGLVAFAAAWAAGLAATAAAVRGRTLPSIGLPALVLAATALTVVPVGVSWVVPVAFAAAACLALLLDARLDVSHLVPLAGTNTELRRQLVWWRPLLQLAPAVAVVALFSTVVPVERAFDARGSVYPAGERLSDVNPLAVAARAPRTDPDQARPLASAEVGAAVGRLRLAVLDRYEATGWSQTAQFAETGERLAPDPLYADGPVPEEQTGRPAAVRLTLDERAPLRAVPTAEMPVRVSSPLTVRYAPAASVLLASGDGVIQYDAVAPRRREAVDATVGRFPADLAACPDSEPIRAVASQLVDGTTAALDRLARIESFLKVRRVYDPAAPGGQTLRSVERFVEQDYARGNLEVFVTAHALLARCAGVPVRIVVGLPAPAVGRTTFTERDLTAWLETPMARSGWVPVDPLPTPDEQLQQAQLARRPEQSPTPTSEPPDPTEAPRRVAPLDIDDPGPSWALVLPAVLLALALVALMLWAWLVPRRTRSRRRRAADPTVAVQTAWAAVTDALGDAGVPLDRHNTPSEVGRLATGRVPLVVPRLLEGFAPLVDSALYSGVPCDDVDAALAWAYADAIIERVPRPRSARLVALRSPRLAAERLLSTHGISLRRRPWRGRLPDTALVPADTAPDDIPAVALASRIGEGSTGTVYRGVLAPGGEQVAVKVFRYGPGDAGFDQRRFDWEVRVAREVSGHPHLPVVHDAGITPATNRPYIVSTLYGGGTLLDRVARGGPMTESEVVAMGGELAIALVTMHQLGVVHADVKPENVFSGPDGWVLGDLGSAWLRASRGPAASMTPPYAAPEVWRGGAPTPLADIYSLGLTMLFAATGRVPTASVPPTRDEVQAAFPNHPAMVRALEADARRRPRTVAELARQLVPELVGAHGARTLTTLSLPTPTVTHVRPG